MSISEKIYALRTKSGVTQEVFAEKLAVSRQSVQKWESGVSLPTIDKLITMATIFNVSMDYLCDRADSAVSDGRTDKEYVPDYGKMHSWESYAKNLEIEYSQLVDEGKDVENLRDVFVAVEKMPPSKHKDEIADSILRTLGFSGPAPLMRAGPFRWCARHGVVLGRVDKFMCVFQ